MEGSVLKAGTESMLDTTASPVTEGYQHWNSSYPQSHNLTEMNGSKFLLQMLDYYVNGTCVGIICFVGLVGNILNIAVLTRRRLHITLEHLERGSHFGLMALAVSDLLFCATALPRTLLPSKPVFYYKGFALYYQVYAKALQNIWIKTSTWLTVLLAIGRYGAICNPLKIRYLLRVSATKLSVLLIFVVWTVLNLPTFWTYEIHRMDNNGTTLYYIDLGYFSKHKAFKDTFIYLWAVLGYFIPLVILLFCNVKLIRALQQSRRLREDHRAHCKARDPSTRITVTLIIIVMTYLILVSPSELLQFLQSVLPEAQSNGYFYPISFVLICTNILQALNFSFNFFLYCSVNAHFRRTLRECLPNNKNKKRKIRKSQHIHIVVQNRTPSNFV